MPLPKFKLSRDQTKTFIKIAVPAFVLLLILIFFLIRIILAVVYLTTVFFGTATFVLFIMSRRNPRRRAPPAVWIRPAACAAAIVALGTGGLSTCNTIFEWDGRMDERVIQKNIRDIRTMQMEVIAKRFSDNFAGQNVLVIVDPRTIKEQSFNENVLPKLLLGIRKKMDVQGPAVYGTTEIDGQPFMPPGSKGFSVAAYRLDALLESHSDYDVVLSFLPMPRDHDAMKIWQQPRDKRPKFVLIREKIYPDEARELKSLIEEERVAGAFITLGGNGQASDETDHKTLAEHRVIWIDADNLEQISKQHKSLFYDAGG